MTIKECTKKNVMGKMAVHNAKTTQRTLRDNMANIPGIMPKGMV
ncbi:MAG: hypothetical protein ACFNPV_06240 [Corynebacterium matruchotii]